MCFFLSSTDVVVARDLWVGSIPCERQFPSTFDDDCVSSFWSKIRLNTDSTDDHDKQYLKAIELELSQVFLYHCVTSLIYLQPWIRCVRGGFEAIEHRQYDMREEIISVSWGD